MQILALIGASVVELVSSTLWLINGRARGKSAGYRAMSPLPHGWLIRQFRQVKLVARPYSQANILVVLENLSLLFHGACSQSLP